MEMQNAECKMQNLFLAFWHFVGVDAHIDPLIKPGCM